MPKRSRLASHVPLVVLVTDKTMLVCAIQNVGVVIQELGLSAGVVILMAGSTAEWGLPEIA